MRAAWHALLAPLPDDVRIERKPVASAEQLEAGTADAIAGWHSLSVHLSDPPRGLRHVLVTLDEHERLVSAGDWVLFSRVETRDGAGITVHDHHNIGGRFEPDGSFRGTVWETRSEQRDNEAEDAAPISSTPSVPTPDQVEALRRLIADVITRAPARSA